MFLTKEIVTEKQIGLESDSLVVIGVCVAVTLLVILIIIVVTIIMVKKYVLVRFIFMLIRKYGPTESTGLLLLRHAE